jgi:hypothetical protein
MRTAPDKRWMPFTARQTFAATETAFCWRARFRMAPLVTGIVEDAVEGGRGRLDVRLWGLLPVARARGEKVDRGEAQRYLAELVWSPMAIVHNPQLRFTQIADRAVRVWVHDEHSYVDLHFNEAGNVAEARSDTRPRHGTPQPWGGRYRDYADFGGICAPARAEAWWDPPDGRFLYWRGTVTRLHWVQ